MTVPYPTLPRGDVTAPRLLRPPLPPPKPVPTAARHCQPPQALPFCHHPHKRPHGSLASPPRRYAASCRDMGPPLRPCPARPDQRYFTNLYGVRQADGARVLALLQPALLVGGLIPRAPDIRHPGAPLLKAAHAGWLSGSTKRSTMPITAPRPWWATAGWCTGTTGCSQLYSISAADVGILKVGCVCTGGRTATTPQGGLPVDIEMQSALRLPEWLKLLGLSRV